MYDIDRSDFAVTDAGNIPFPVINVEKLDGIGAFGAAWLKLTVADFNNAGGNIIVKYTANGSTNDGAGNKWAPFSITFTPVGLVPTYQTPPQPQEVYNLEVPQW
jgi:hypothetical protein